MLLAYSNKKVVKGEVKVELTIAFIAFSVDIWAHINAKSPQKKHLRKILSASLSVTPKGFKPLTF